MSKRFKCKELNRLADRLEECGIDFEAASRSMWAEGREFDNEQLVFEYNGKRWSAVNGYGTYGGCAPYTDGVNAGLIELVEPNNPELRTTGWMTAADVLIATGVGFPDPKTLTVTEIIEQVREDMCDNYCKYRDLYRNEDETPEVCNTCPLDLL